MHTVTNSVNPVEMLQGVTFLSGSTLFAKTKTLFREKIQILSRSNPSIYTMFHSAYIESSFMENAICLKMFKGIYSFPIEIIKGLTDKGQFQYLTGLKGPQEGTYLYTILSSNR